jgi:hypothetical protein
MALYDTRFGLPQGVADYLNQGLPSISGIFPPVAGINPIKPSPDDSVVGLPYYKDEPMPQPSGGDGFSPYDIRPGDSSIRTSDQYNPYAYRQAAAKSGFGIPSGILADSSYLYPQKTGIEQLLSKIPTPLGFVKKGLDALGDKLPVNRTAIFQNELLGQGIKLDNIGRIVTDNYRTPEGIMAGYNPVSGGLLNMLTGGAYGEPTQYGLEKSVAEKQENIRNTLQDKYGLSNQQIDQVLDEIEETGTYKGKLGFNQTMGKTTNLFEDLFNVGQFDLMQKNALKKSNLIFEQKLKEKRESDPAFIEQQKIEKAAKTRRDFQQTVKDAEKKAADEFAGKGSGASGPAGGAAKKAADKKAADKKAAENQDAARGGGGGGGGQGDQSGGRSSSSGESGYGGFCFDPNTPIQMVDGSEKKIKDIQLGDDTKGGEVTGVFQFKATDEIHDYKGVTVAGSHYVKEDGKFIMVKDSLLSVKIDKIPVVYSLDTTGRRIFINDIEFADYNGDGIAKGFLENAGVDLAGFDKEVLRQVEHRLI